MTTGAVVPGVTLSGPTVTVAGGSIPAQTVLNCLLTDATLSFAVNKTASPASAAPGATVTYTVTVQNTGVTAYPGAAFSDDLTDVLDDATFGAATAPLGTAAFASPNLTWTGDLPAGGSATVTYTVTVLPDDERGDSIASNFLLAPGETPPTGGECVPTDAQQPDCTTTPITGVTYTKSVETSETPVRTGTELTYTVVVTNTGATTVDVLRDDDLSDVLDDATLAGAAESDTASVTVDGPTDDVLAMIDWASDVTMSDDVSLYIVDLVQATRDEAALQIGASARASLALMRAARVLAASEGRDDVLPDDVRSLATAVLTHRLILTPDALLRDETIEHVVERVLARVKVPVGKGASRDKSSQPRT